LPTYRATIRVRRPWKSPRAWNKDTILTARGGQIEALVNDVHEVIALDY
jgi:hypothetical protein